VLEKNRRSERVFMPILPEEKTAKLRARWKQAVARAKEWEKDDF